MSFIQFILRTLTWHLSMDGWETSFLFLIAYFRCYVVLKEYMCMCFTLTIASIFSSLLQDCSYTAGRTFVAGIYDQWHLVRVVKISGWEISFQASNSPRYLSTYIFPQRCSYCIYIYSLVQGIIFQDIREITVGEMMICVQRHVCRTHSINGCFSSWLFQCWYCLVHTLWN